MNMIQRRAVIALASLCIAGVAMAEERGTKDEAKAMADAAFEHIKKVGPEKAYKDYIQANLIGTPGEILEQHRARTAMVGDYDIVANFSYGGMPFEDVYDQAKRFADKILPQLKG